MYRNKADLDDKESLSDNLSRMDDYNYLLQGQQEAQLLQTPQAEQDFIQTRCIEALDPASEQKQFPHYENFNPDLIASALENPKAIFSAHNYQTRRPSLGIVQIGDEMTYSSVIRWPKPKKSHSGPVNTSIIQNEENEHSNQSNRSK